jgi:DNA-binding CsgD family transcriptional regulator
VNRTVHPHVTQRRVPPTPTPDEPVARSRSDGSLFIPSTGTLACVTASRPGTTTGLSDTERRIVELVRTGATNREIARSLFLSVKAVEANLTRLYRRLGVRNRSQLARAVDSADVAD